MTDKKVFKLGRRGVFLAFLATLLCTVAGLWSLIPLAQSISADSTWDDDSVSASHLATGPTTTQTVFLPHVVRGTNVARTSVFGLQLYNDLTAPSAALPLAKQASVNWVRWPIWWYSVEPVNTTPEYYRFDYWDRSIRATSEAGMQIIGTLGSNPTWAATYPEGLIDKVPVQEFVQFVRAVVERYDGDGLQDAPGSPVINNWELYNEPDGDDPIRAQYSGIGYWGRYGAEYAQMLCAVYPEIKKANPSARVLIGGLAYEWFHEDGGPFERAFLGDVLAAGGGSCFDVMAFHAYPTNGARWSAWGNGLIGKANYLRITYPALADKPMVVTEAGVNSEPPATPETQADWVVKVFAQAMAARLDALTWWTWPDLGGGYGSFGLLTKDSQPKPAYYAFQYAAAKLGGASFARGLSSSESGGAAAVEGYLFTSPGALYVMWSNDGVTYPVNLSGSRARVLDSLGKLVAQVYDGDDGNTDGQVRVTIGSGPVYVEVTS